MRPRCGSPRPGAEAGERRPVPMPKAAALRTPEAPTVVEVLAARLRVRGDPTVQRGRWNAKGGARSRPSTQGPG